MLLPSQVISSSFSFSFFIIYFFFLYIFLAGGKIFVFSGLLDVTQNDDGLAFILGHEVAHVLASTFSFYPPSLSSIYISPTLSLSPSPSLSFSLM